MGALMTKVEAAKMFGASVQGVTAWIRQGMPAVTEVKKGRRGGKVGRPRTMVEPEAARNWLIEHNVRSFLKSEIRLSQEAQAEKAKDAGPPRQRSGKNAGGGVAASPAPRSAGLPPGASPPAPAGKPINVSPGVEGALDRLRGIELRAFSDYVRARNIGDVMGQRAHMKLHSEAVRRMLESESELDNRKEVEAQVWSQVEQALTAWAEPVKSLIENMPRSLASRCNLAEPQTAETVLRDWVHGQLFPLMNRRPR